MQRYYKYFKMRLFISIILVGKHKLKHIEIKKEINNKEKPRPNNTAAVDKKENFSTIGCNLQCKEYPDRYCENDGRKNSDTDQPKFIFEHDLKSIPSCKFFGRFIFVFPSKIYIPNIPSKISKKPYTDSTSEQIRQY